MADKEDKKEKAGAAAQAPHDDKKKAEDKKASGAQAGGKEAAEESGKEPEKGKKELSENEVLKLYLQQTMKELDRVRAQLDDEKKAKDEAKKQSEALGARLKSLTDEYDNYRRRTAQEKENIMGDAVAKAVNALLPALDSLEQAAACGSGDEESFRRGVELTLKQLAGGFEKLGVTEIEAKGETFDPNRHNAVMHVEDDSLGESVVADVFQKGYAIGDRVIRHSAVKVAN